MQTARSKPIDCRRSMAAWSSGVIVMVGGAGAPSMPGMPPSGPASLMRDRNSCWLPLMSCRSCGFCLPSSWSMGCRICGLACTICRRAWNCGFWRRKSREPAPPSPPPMPGIPWGNISNGCEFGPPGPPSTAAAATAAAAAASLPAAAGASSTGISGMPVMRNSTALSGLLKAARMARWTCSLSKPISQIALMEFSSSCPVARVEAAEE
mmetsp:Transcript_23683/g.65730  ORF Transcript_23683/g.65730 Transcript_23683/m.65730 type:complete len:209 (+) Transcript_23683:136-762(+)